MVVCTSWHHNSRLYVDETFWFPDWGTLFFARTVRVWSSCELAHSHCGLPVQKNKLVKKERSHLLGKNSQFWLLREDKTINMQCEKEESGTLGDPLKLYCSIYPEQINKAAVVAWEGYNDQDVMPSGPSGLLRVLGTKKGWKNMEEVSVIILIKWSGRGEITSLIFSCIFP